MHWDMQNKELTDYSEYIGMQPCCGCYTYMIVVNWVISNDSFIIEPDSMLGHSPQLQQQIGLLVNHLDITKEQIFHL